MEEPCKGRVLRKAQKYFRPVQEDNLLNFGNLQASATIYEIGFGFNSCRHLCAYGKWSKH